MYCILYFTYTVSTIDYIFILFLQCRFSICYALMRIGCKYVFTLNQYCLLWYFKCPQIKLIYCKSYKNQKPTTTNTTYLPWYMNSMFALLECVCEPTLSHQTASIKPSQKCGPYMPMAVLIRVTYVAYQGRRNYDDSWSSPSCSTDLKNRKICVVHTVPKIVFICCAHCPKNNLNICSAHCLKNSIYLLCTLSQK